MPQLHGLHARVVVEFDVHGSDVGRDRLVYAQIERAVVVEGFEGTLEQNWLARVHILHLL